MAGGMLMPGGRVGAGGQPLVDNRPWSELTEEEKEMARQQKTPEALRREQENAGHRVTDSTAFDFLPVDEQARIKEQKEKEQLNQIRILAGIQRGRQFQRLLDRTGGVRDGVARNPYKPPQPLGLMPPSNFQFSTDTQKEPKDVGGGRLTGGGGRSALGGGRLG